MILSEIENYKEVKSLLDRIMTVIPESSTGVWQRYVVFIILIPVVLMAEIYLSYNKILVGVCGFTLITLMLWGLFKIRTNNYFPRSVKQSSWWMVVVIASISAIVYYKIFIL